MTHRKPIKFSSESVSESLEHMKGLSESDKKLEAAFLVEEIESVDVERALQMVNRKINGNNKTHRLVSIITRVAAILTLPLLILSIWQFSSISKTNSLTENSISWQEIENPSGIRSKVILPDGSRLWLNAESKIGYNIPFVRESRQIELSGEAYFEVTKNTKAPFIVKTADTKIRVLGTQFNVKAYPEEERIEVALKEGSVEFSVLNSKSKYLQKEMVVNDYLVFDKVENKINIENKNIDQYISWYQNILMFKDVPIIEWARIIERWYGVKIDIADEDIQNYHFNGTIKNETVRDVMQILEMTLDVSYTIDHKNITIQKSAK